MLIDAGADALFIDAATGHTRHVMEVIGKLRSLSNVPVVAAVRGGLLSLEDALSQYRLTAEEFIAWQKAIDKWGMQGLRTTRIQSYRS